MLLTVAAVAKATGGYVRNINVFADGYMSGDGIDPASTNVARTSPRAAASFVSPTSSNAR